MVSLLFVVILGMEYVCQVNQQKYTVCSHVKHINFTMYYTLLIFLLFSILLLGQRTLQNLYLPTDGLTFRISKTECGGM